MNIFKKMLKIIVLFNTTIIFSGITIFIFLIFKSSVDTIPITALCATIVVILGEKVSKEREKNKKRNLVNIFKKVVKIIILFNTTIVSSGITIFIFFIFGFPINTVSEFLISALCATIVIILGEEADNEREKRKRKKEKPFGYF